MVPPNAMSANPGHQALSSLISGGNYAMSKPSDAPPATTAMSGPLTAIANTISIPQTSPAAEKSETSPASVTSLASLGSTGKVAAANSTAAASPVDDLAANSVARGLTSAQPYETQTQESQDASRAYSYPGQLAHTDASHAQARGMSLPMSGLNPAHAPRSPAGSHKKHKCQYCDTEFTRHHNLKSHLLTHSQEKPYVCNTCQMRFRRLHDLKRHSKLHTGERPHVCPKCDRKFARGDALARHAKGQGGCAGRRSSMGSYGGDEDYDESTADMEGVVYAEPEPAHEMSEEDARRFSLPSIKTQHVQAGSQDSYSSQHRGPSTYPPAGPRPPRQQTGSLYPPAPDHGGSSSSTSPSDPRSTGGHSANTSISTMHSPSGFAPGGMTESPKPLSPSGMVSHQLGHEPGSINRQRSPSLTTQFQQQHFGRRDSRASPQLSLPSPHGPGPKLPGLSNLAPPGLAPPGSQYGPLSPNSQGPSYQPPMTAPPRGSLHQSSNNRDNNMFMTENLHHYVASLEDKVKTLNERVAALEEADRNSQNKIYSLQQEILGSRTPQAHHQPPAHPQLEPHHMQNHGQQQQ